MHRDMRLIEMARNYADNVRNETPEQKQAREERDARITAAMAKLCGTENMYDEDGDVRF